MLAETPSPTLAWRCRRARVACEKGEVVAHADRDALLALMTTLRDDPRFAFEQVMDICGVDWPERAERFDVVYNLLSVSLNQRLRVIVTTDESTPVPSVHTRLAGARPGGSARPGTCSASCSPASPICGAS